jgi:adenylate kinase family enzyme
VRRVSVVGSPGSGKTTLGRQLAACLDAQFIELDSIFHQPDWAELPVEDFREQVSSRLEAAPWVVDGNYSAVQDLVWKHADTVVWLDLPRRVVVRRVVLRTLRRAITRQRLWNDNREPLSNFWRFDPETNIIRFTWVKHPEYGERYSAELDRTTNAHLRFIRLRSASEVRSLLAEVAHDPER